MIYFLFLLSVLISALFYLRLSSRFNSWDMELSEGIKREMTSLITEFNSTAKRNITLIEEKTKDTNQFLDDISYHIQELKAYKESLLKDIENIQIKLDILSKEESEKQELKKQLDEQIKLKYQSSYSHDNDDSLLYLPVQDDDVLQISLNATSIAQSSNVQDKLPISSLEKETKNLAVLNTSDLEESHSQLGSNLKEEDTHHIPSVDTYLDMKQKVIELNKEGISSDVIAKKLNITKGEVDLILLIQKV